MVCSNIRDVTHDRKQQHPSSEVGIIPDVKQLAVSTTESQVDILAIESDTTNRPSGLESMVTGPNPELMLLLQPPSAQV